VGIKKRSFVKLFLRIIFTCLLLCSYAPALYSVGARNINLLETNGAQYPMTVYYPAQSNGANTTPVTNAGAFPTIIFIHGLMVDRTAFSLLASGFVQNGYVFFVPDLPGGTLPLKSECTALVDRLVQAIVGKSFQGDIAFLCNICDSNRLIVMGHSWGGGLAMELGRTNPQFKVAVALAPAQISDINTLNSSATPLVILTGSMDAIVPNATVRAMYNQLTPPKVILTLKDGSHNGFLDHPSQLEETLMTGKRMDNLMQIQVTVENSIMYLKRYLTY
jgi:dienelactone hydrolase